MDLAEVDRAVSRPGRYFLDDGLWEIVVGLWVSLTVALPLSLGGDAGPWALITVLLVRPAVLAAKSRWVFPRTGRVTYAPPASRSRWTVAAAVGLAAGVAAVLVLVRRSPTGPEGAHVVAGMIFGAAFLFASWRWGQPRWRIAALAMLALGVSVATSGLERSVALAAHVGGVALILMASGGAAFASYLRHAPGPGADADGR
jgi:hypothetical protein